jgi:hypothetical protein
LRLDEVKRYAPTPTVSYTTTPGGHRPRAVEDDGRRRREELAPADRTVQEQPGERTGLPSIDFVD